MTNQLVNTAETNFSKFFGGEKEATRSHWTIWHVGAGIGLIGGTLILFCAAFLAIFQFLDGETSHGNWLFAVFLTLWFLGAHCFDKVEDIEKAERIK